MSADITPREERAPAFTPVATRKLYILGFILPLLSVLAGLIYPLFFVFNKQTRRMGATLLLWWLATIILAMIVNYWLITHGYNFLRVTSVIKQ